MTSDLDIYRATKLLLDRHGPKDAPWHVADRIADLRDGGYEEGARTWGKIRAALLDARDLRFRHETLH